MNDMGTAVECQTTSLNYLRNSIGCIVGLFMDDAALQSQKNGLKVVETNFKLDGHILESCPRLHMTTGAASTVI